jgi:hypothetical protein
MEMTVNDETRSVIRHGRAVILGPLQYRLFAAIAKQHPKGVDNERLMTILYSDRIDGPPLCPAVSPMVAVVNGKIEPLKIRIRKDYSWGGKYRIIELME